MVPQNRTSTPFRASGGLLMYVPEMSYVSNHSTIQKTLKWQSNSEFGLRNDCGSQAAYVSVTLNVNSNSNNQQKHGQNFYF